MYPSIGRPASGIVGNSIWPAGFLVATAVHWTNLENVTQGTEVHGGKSPIMAELK